GLRWWSEPFRPTGGVAAHGVINALGRPELDFLELFVRETVQNSWDARNADGPISFTLKGWQLRGRPLSTLREAVFAERPAEGLTLNETLSQDPLPVLAVSDRGTAGLGGPTRADV